MDLDKEKIVTFIETFTIPKPPNDNLPSMEAFLAPVMADPKGYQGGRGGYGGHGGCGGCGGFGGHGRGRGGGGGKENNDINSKAKS